MLVFPQVPGGSRIRSLTNPEIHLLDPFIDLPGNLFLLNDHVSIELFPLICVGRNFPSKPELRSEVPIPVIFPTFGFGATAVITFRATNSFWPLSPDLKLPSHYRKSLLCLRIGRKRYFPVKSRITTVFPQLLKRERPKHPSTLYCVTPFRTR